METVLDIAREHIANRRRLLVGVVNVAKIVNMRRDLVLRSGLEEADLVLADGAPIVWLSRMLGKPLPERVAGIDIMHRLLQEANDKRYRVYFLGAKPNVLQKVIWHVMKEYPELCVAGYRDGYFSEAEEKDVAGDVRNSRADILFVGISSPKKENFLRRWHGQMSVPVCHGVGGSFDILAGVTKRAPIWMRRCGLEWLYRVIQEPRRMWKRYLTTNTIFLKVSLQAIIQDRFSKLSRRFSLNSVPSAKNRDK
ncbi:MAG: WecB/TagA/CpsF family glycosyltransferase [Planctomycetota bacterium]|jgi:N-acetylglucosaminyldiphosphoundecaprenol N-acetyl-beta-D-mannosaminyltransferase